jgi:hypothetical protein
VPKRPVPKSRNACRISASVFMTKGPRPKMGSLRGVPFRTSARVATGANISAPEPGRSRKERGFGLLYRASPPNSRATGQHDDDSRMAVRRVEVCPAFCVQRYISHIQLGAGLCRAVLALERTCDDTYAASRLGKIHRRDLRGFESLIASEAA